MPFDLILSRINHVFSYPVLPVALTNNSEDESLRSTCYSLRALKVGANIVTSVLVPIYLKPNLGLFSRINILLGLGAAGNYTFVSCGPLDNPCAYQDWVFNGGHWLIYAVPALLTIGNAVTSPDATDDLAVKVSLAYLLPPAASIIAKLGIFCSDRWSERAPINDGSLPVYGSQFSGATGRHTETDPENPSSPSFN